MSFTRRLCSGSMAIAVLALLSLVPSLGALEMVWVDGARAAPTPPAGRSLPGRADPQRAAKPVAYRVNWDDYTTYIVVEAGAGTRARAFVSTHNKADQGLAVAYCGIAFRDEAGDVHIDCRGVRIAGPLAGSWSPDSFAIHADGSVRVIDDKNRSNAGAVAELIPGHGDKKDTMRQRYDGLRHYVNGMVSGMW